MAAPSYEQITSFSRVTGQLKEAAIDEFMGELVEGMSRDEVMELAVWVAEKYRFLGSELGAQWYDLCAELAGYELEQAEIVEGTDEIIKANAEKAAITALDTGDFKTSFAEFLSNEIMNSIRMTGDANLWRDYERGLAGGKWCRVPVGDTCAWCMMLASQGAWYVDKKSAEFTKGGKKYHDGCDCVPVYYADAESIAGYGKLQEYKSMYYEAENMREANDSGRQPYPDDLQDRINLARLAHEQKEANDETDKQWTPWNETLIIMRYMNDLK